MSHEAFLSKVPLFSNCSPAEIAAIAAVAQEHAYAAGQIIVTQGTPGQAFYMVLSGRVEILRDNSSTSSGRCPCSIRLRVPQRSEPSTRRTA
jgi:CRP-like cAMP-binding protein